MLSPANSLCNIHQKDKAWDKRGGLVAAQNFTQSLAVATIVLPIYWASGGLPRPMGGPVKITQMII